MPELVDIATKRSRRGGWNRNQPTRDGGPQQGPLPPRDPIAFINSLTHTKGVFGGQPFHLRPWQVRIVKQIFKKRRDGRRQYRTCLLMLPRKNGKSELAAAIALYGLLADGEVGAEVYSAGADRDQAGLVFGVAAQMIRNDPTLAQACYIVDSQKRIVHEQSASFYRAISAEAYSKHGFNASMVIYDELHAAPDRRLYDVLSTSMGARQQPLFLVISTAGYDKHSILWELYSHAKKVQENPQLDPTFLPLLYEAPADADWTSEKVWKGCNPALGDFRSIEEMRIVCARAKAIPAQENTFRRLYLNQWTEQDTRWLSLTAWDACQGPIDWAAFAGRRCYLGLDLSRTTDLTAVVAVFPDADGVGFSVLPHFFVPADRIGERVIRDRVPYDEWARRGSLTACPGPTVNQLLVRAYINDLCERFDVRFVAYDPYNAVELMRQLGDEDQRPCVKVRQTKAELSSPSKALEEAVLTGALHHDGHPVLRWNIGNVAIDIDFAGNIQPSKEKSTERIDGVTALVTALDVLYRDAQQGPMYTLQVVG
jgi:phage terminase large subunit-like protein